MAYSIVSGVYVIRNTVNGKLYVGSASILKKRLNAHRNQLRKGAHCNQHLQNAWDKYGEAAFVFEVLEETPPDAAQLVAREQHWMDALGAAANGYNLRAQAESNLGMTFSPEARANMSAAHRARYERMGKDERAAIGERTRQAQSSVEARAKRGASAKAAHEKDPTIRLRMSEARKGKKHAPETIAKMVAARAGFRHTDESRAKLSAAMKGRPQSEETKAKRSAAIRAAYERKRLKSVLSIQE